MAFFKLLVSFAPWISFLIIAQGSLFRLKAGLIVAALLTVVMAVLRLHRGIIMWVGIVFFIFATIAVVGLENMWTARYMGVLANGALALGTWITLAMGMPFTLEYARDHTDPSRWSDPLFIRTNYFMTSVWGVAFSIGTTLAWLKTLPTGQPEWLIETANYTVLVSCVAFSSWYPEVVKRKAMAARAQAGQQP